MHGGYQQGLLTTPHLIWAGRTNGYLPRCESLTDKACPAFLSFRPRIRSAAILPPHALPEYPPAFLPACGDCRFREWAQGRSPAPEFSVRVGAIRAHSHCAGPAAKTHPHAVQADGRDLQILFQSASFICFLLNVQPVGQLQVNRTEARCKGVFGKLVVVVHRVKVRQGGKAPLQARVDAQIAALVAVLHQGRPEQAPAEGNVDARGHQPDVCVGIRVGEPRPSPGCAKPFRSSGCSGSHNRRCLPAMKLTQACPARSSPGSSAAWRHRAARPAA